MLDFYGTVVHEDDVVIDKICTTIKQASPTGASAAEIGSHWWSVFSNAFKNSFGATFQTQRALEQWSLDYTCDNFNASCDTRELSELMFAHWQTASLFEDAVQFLSAIEVPVVVLSNIDRADVEAAIAVHDLDFGHLITSEDVRSYKPRPELFEAGLETLGLGPADVLHIGDSATSDVAGAASLGIPVAWVNRAGKTRPAGIDPDFEVPTLSELIPIVGHLPK